MLLFGSKWQWTICDHSNAFEVRLLCWWKEKLQLPDDGCDRNRSAKELTRTRRHEISSERLGKTSYNRTDELCSRPIEVAEGTQKKGPFENLSFASTHLWILCHKCYNYLVLVIGRYVCLVWKSELISVQGGWMLCFVLVGRNLEGIGKRRVEREGKGEQCQAREAGIHTNTTISCDNVIPLSM